MSFLSAKLRCALAIALSVSGSSATSAGDARPSADAVFEAYLRARGGEAALQGLVTIERIGWIATDLGSPGFAAGSYHTCIRYPDRIAMEIDAGSWQLAQALRADGAVECEHGFRACRRASETVARDLVETARHANKDLLDKSALWREAPVTPSADGTAWRLRLNDEKGNWAEFSRVSGHLTWQGRMKRARRYGEWRVVERVSIPFRLEDYTDGDDGRAWRNTVQLKEVVISPQPSSWCTERFGTD